MVVTDVGKDEGERYPGQFMGMLRTDKSEQMQTAAYCMAVL